MVEGFTTFNCLKKKLKKTKTKHITVYYGEKKIKPVFQKNSLSARILKVVQNE